MRYKVEPENQKIGIVEFISCLPRYWYAMVVCLSDCGCVIVSDLCYIRGILLTISVRTWLTWVNMLMYGSAVVVSCKCSGCKSGCCNQKYAYSGNCCYN